jgi:two-component system chemotaxis sensor kinase CheA
MSFEQAIREQIDDLATRLLLAEGGNDPVPGALAGLSQSLAGIGERAGAEGWETTARLARELAAAGASPASLREGLARLQQAIDEDCRRARPADPPASLAQDPELLSDFVVEAREHLATIEQQCLALEQDPAQADAVHSLFRGFHTIKGLAGFLELSSIQEVAHEVETALDLARNGELAVTPAVIDVILAGADFLVRGVEAVESTLAGSPAASPPPDAALLARIRAVATAEQDAFPMPEAAAAVPAAPATPAAAPAAAKKTADTFSVRVDTAKLDYLMDMVGEMVIAQSLVRHDPLFAGVTDPNLLRNLSLLTRVTGEVQRTTMAMRMIPIGQLFKRMARLVRDLSRKAGKHAELETSGEDTELDKTIAEELADPLMHMVRNSIDHGIETPEGRAVAGKDPVARVRLAAFHQGGQIVVEIADDGRGLDREKILRKARQKGLVSEDANLTDTEVYNLIFEPGFSTAEQVTDVSGRGVGMDVVRKHILKLRGRIDVESHPGKGSRFLLKLPLTLAIIDGLIVGVGDARYIVPIYTVREIIRPTDETIFTVRGREEMALVHGRLLPVVRFYKRFNVKPRSEDPCQSLMIVSESDDKVFCLMVDDLLGRQEVVIKSLGETLKNIAGIAGGTILGDGRVGLIIDMDSVFGWSANA